MSLVTPWLDAVKLSIGLTVVWLLCTVLPGCYQPARIIRADGSRVHGAVKLDLCLDTALQFRDGPSRKRRVVPFSEIATIITKEGRFLVLPKGVVKDGNGDVYNYNRDILVKVIEQGDILLLEYCRNSYPVAAL